MKERTIANLLKSKARIYVYCSGEPVARLFLKNAEAEGFAFGDGIKPTDREPDDLYRINPDWTISYVGWGGHMAFRAHGMQSAVLTIFADYGKYLSGERNYIIKRIRKRPVR